MEFEYEFRPKTITGVRVLFAVIGLLFGSMALRPGEHIVVRVIFGCFLAVGLWCLFGLLKQGLTRLILEESEVRIVRAEIAEVSRGMQFSSKNRKREDAIHTVICRKDGKRYRAKTMEPLDFSHVGMIVPVFVSVRFPFLYRVDLDIMSPPEEERPAAQEPEADDPPPVRRSCFKWIFNTCALWMILLSLPLFALGAIAFTDLAEAWPLLFSMIAGLVVFSIGLLKTVRCVRTFVLGDCLSARVCSVTKDGSGRYYINLRWRDRGFSVKKDFVGRDLVGTRANVYVSRRDPEIYDADI